VVSKAQSLDKSVAKRARHIGPWAASVGLHVGLVAIGFSLTWTIIRLEDRAPSPIVEAGLPALVIPAVMEVQPLELPGPGPAPQPPSPEPVVVPEQPARQASAPLDAPSVPLVPITMASAFAGSDLPPGDLVFVLDASGTMIPWFHDVLGELERSLMAMRPTDDFAVVLFRGSEAIVAYPGRPCPARGRYREKALDFLRDYSRWGGPALGSDPIAALKTAFSFDPATIVLLSGGMDASTSFSLDANEVHKELATAAASATRNGGHPTTIRCVQLVPDATVDPDPLLTAIAVNHGGGQVHLVTPEDLDP
jgi:hypothetical protein